MALKGDNMENNVLFWLEIQNYKVSFSCKEINLEILHSTVNNCYIELPKLLCFTNKLYMSMSTML